MYCEREKLMRLMREKVTEWQSTNDSEKVTMLTVLDYACKNGDVGRV